MWTLLCTIKWQAIVKVKVAFLHTSNTRGLWQGWSIFLCVLKTQATVKALLHIWLTTGVDPLVCFQVTSLSKSLTEHITLRHMYHPPSLHLSCLHSQQNHWQVLIRLDRKRALSHHEMKPSNYWTGQRQLSSGPYGVCSGMTVSVWRFNTRLTNYK